MIGWTDGPPTRARVLAAVNRIDQAHVDAALDAVTHADTALERLYDLAPVIDDVDPVTADDTWRRTFHAALKTHPILGRHLGRLPPRPARTPRVTIGYDIGSGRYTAGSIIAGIDAATGPELHLVIDSNGGSVLAAVDIGVAIARKRAAGTRVVAHVEGQAASAASYIAAICDEVIMAPAAKLMIHDARYDDDRPATAAENRLSDRLSSILAKAYARRTRRGTPAQWRALMTQETWFTADQAVAAGLADRIGHRMR